MCIYIWYTGMHVQTQHSCMTSYVPSPFPLSVNTPRKKHYTGPNPDSWNPSLKAATTSLKEQVLPRRLFATEICVPTFWGLVMSKLRSFWGKVLEGFCACFSLAYLPAWLHTSRTCTGSTFSEDAASSAEHLLPLTFVEGQASLERSDGRGELVRFAAYASNSSYEVFVRPTHKRCDVHDVLVVFVIELVLQE